MMVLSMIVDAYNPLKAEAIQSEIAEKERLYKTDLLQLAQEAVNTTPGTRLTISETLPDPKSPTFLVITVDGPENFQAGEVMLPTIHHKSLVIRVPEELGEGQNVTIVGFDNDLKLMKEKDTTVQLPSYKQTWSLDMPHVIDQEEKRMLIEQGVKSLLG